MKLAFVTIYVKDLDASIKFYEDIMSLKMKSRFQPGPTTEIVFFENEGAELELIHDATISLESYNEHLSIGFEVEKMDEFVSHLEAHNVAIVRGPLPAGANGQMIFFKDLDGAMIEVIANA